jgi:hypothetical protein
MSKVDSFFGALELPAFLLLAGEARPFSWVWPPLGTGLPAAIELRLVTTRFGEISETVADALRGPGRDA